MGAEYQTMNTAAFACAFVSKRQDSKGGCQPAPAVRTVVDCGNARNLTVTPGEVLLAVSLEVPEHAVVGGADLGAAQGRIQGLSHGHV